ncbi:MAG: efflux RND transporter periplasmic adaptor subunit [Myxococcales bacterium]|nr:MAG: efflux RND transporter periplasmic adaptor subunit [Myxococcales bacterium]
MPDRIAKIVPVLLSALCLACGDRGATPTQADPLRVVVARPAVADSQRTIVIPGGLEAWESAALYARVTGYLEEVAVDIGDRVESGRVLARIVVPEMSADIERGRAEVAAAGAELVRARAERELAGVTRTRLATLREREAGAVAQQALDAAAADEQVAAAGIEVGDARLAVARADLARLEAMSAFAVIQAPFAGRITRRTLHPGALVREGNSSDAEPVVEISRTDRLRLVFMVPESLVPHVAAGDAVHVRFDAFPARTVEASIARIAGALDSATRSMRVEADLANDDGRLAPGMYASVELRVRMDDPGRSVASRAVRGQGADRYVLVAVDDVLERRSVSVAYDDGRRAVVASGLTGGDLVVIAGSPLAVEGVRVATVEESQE